MTILEKIFVCNDEDQQLAFGGALAIACDNRGSIIFLQGELGAGKTTLVRGFLRQLGYQGKVKSPTYTLIEIYDVGSHHILHIDLYRITKSDEVITLGLADQLTDETICLVEWPALAQEKLPPADLTCYIAPFAQGRQLRVVAHTLRGKDILQTMVMA